MHIKTKHKKPGFRKSLYADLGIFLSAVIWGSDYVAIKLSLGVIPPLYMSGIRFGAAFFIMYFIFRKRMRNVKKKEILAGVLIGALMIGGFAFQTIALQFTTAGKSAFLTSTYAVIVPFLSWMIFKKNPGYPAFIGAFVCLSGIALLSLENTFSISYGDSLTLLCAVFFAGNIIAVAYYVRIIDPVVITVIETGAAAVISLVLALFLEPRITGVTSTILWCMLYLVFFGTVAANLISNIALGYTSSIRASLIFSAESAFAAFFSFLLLGEVFTFKMIIGCILIFFAVIITEFGDAFRRHY